MLFETVVVGALGVNCYILGCPVTGEGVVVDPGAEGERILRRVEKLGLKLKHVLNTHGHFDHVGANRLVMERSGAPLLIHEGDLRLLQRAAASAQLYGASAEDSPPPSAFLQDGGEVSFGSVSLSVLHTPGHTPGGCCLYLPGEKIVITGDTLFDDSIGRTDLPGGSHPQLLASIGSKLLTLPDEVAVYPGHGPSSSIGKERAGNPYLQGLRR